MTLICFVLQRSLNGFKWTRDEYSGLPFLLPSQLQQIKRRKKASFKSFQLLFIIAPCAILHESLQHCIPYFVQFYEHSNNSHPKSTGYIIKTPSIWSVFIPKMFLFCNVFFSGMCKLVKSSFLIRILSISQKSILWNKWNHTQRKPFQSAF